MCTHYRWAAIASYLPQRTDNDIKNYWNTHLKKKLNKQPLTASSSSGSQMTSSDPTSTCHALKATSKCSMEETSTQTNKSTVNPNFSTVSNNAALYASSTENISKLLQGFMNSAPRVDANSSYDEEKKYQNEVIRPDHALINSYSLNHQEIDPLLRFDSDASISQPVFTKFDEVKPGALSQLEKWLFDEPNSTGDHVDLMDLSADMF